MLAQTFDGLILPWQAVHSEITKDCYHRRSRQFLVHANYMDASMWSHRNPSREVVNAERAETDRAMRQFIKESVEDPRKARNEVLSFMEHLQERMGEKQVSRRISPAQARNLLKPIRLALELNEVSLPWKKFLRLIPRQNRSKDREYTLEEVRAILRTATSPALKVAILFMTSSGMRVGAFDFLKVGDVNPLVQDGKVVCGQVLVYSGEGDDEYLTLVSMEAYQAFVDYLARRRSLGESMRPDSPALLVRYRNDAHRMGGKHIGHSISDILWKTGMRTEKKRRHEVQVDHGFRKFYDNVAKDRIDESYVEKLIGHDTGTKEHYDRKLPEKCVKQYLQAMPLLSIDPAYRAEGELKMKLGEVMQERDKEFTDLRLKLLERDSQVNAPAEKVRNQEATLKEVHSILRSIQEKGR